MPIFFFNRLILNKLKKVEAKGIFFFYYFKVLLTSGIKDGLPCQIETRRTLTGNLQHRNCVYFMPFVLSAKDDKCLNYIKFYQMSLITLHPC